MTPSLQASKRPGVVDVGGLRLAVIICYDLEFPELIRQVALDGARRLVAPANRPVVGWESVRRRSTVAAADRPEVHRVLRTLWGKAGAKPWFLDTLNPAPAREAR